MEKRVFGQKINYIRKLRKITSEKLAETCNVNPGHIRQIESGARLPSIQLLVAICNSLKVSPEYLLSHELPELNEYDHKFDDIVEKLNKLSPEQLNTLDCLLVAYIKKEEAVN